MRLDRLFDVGAQDGPERVGDRVLTIPNVLSLLRLCALPFVWVDIGNGRFVRALVVLAVFAATDWVDGYVARRFDQVSRLGKVLDPISDRILIVVVVLALLVNDIVPGWVVAVVLVRDVLVGGVGLSLLLRGGTPPAVTRIGKAATFQLMTAFPTFLLAEALDGTGADVARAVAWVAFASGAVLYWVAAAQYARTLRADAAADHG